MLSTSRYNYIVHSSAYEHKNLGIINYATTVQVLIDYAFKCKITKKKIKETLDYIYIYYICFKLLLIAISFRKYLFIKYLFYSLYYNNPITGNRKISNITSDDKKT